MLIDENLSWKYHIVHLASKISKKIGIHVIAVRHFVPLATLHHIYIHHQVVEERAISMASPTLQDGGIGTSMTATFVCQRSTCRSSMPTSTVLLDRAEKIPSTNRGKRKEKQHVMKVLMNNNYPLQFIKKCDSAHRARHRDSNTNNTANEVTTPFAVLPYVKSVTERVSRVLRNNGVKVGCKPLSTLGTIFSRLKDTPTLFQS